MQRGAHRPGASASSKATSAYATAAIVGIGKAGNPAIMDGVDPRLIVSSRTTVRDCEGLIATPGAIDVHVHFDCAGLCEHALASGITTMIGGSLGPITVGIDSGGPFNVGQDAAGRGGMADEFRLPGTRQFASAGQPLASSSRPADWG